MRAGLCTVPQALTVEAASIVKQAVTLARRRGHAQVTPLHVASAMLASSTGLLRRACLQSHSHPLQCKALELCFNVALNRLPASTSSPLLGPHSFRPSLSNALVAAFKRAQAHQRRGSIENQQQPILALKIEIEQLIVSILDDPSVSRVMREAGFNSSQVKNRVEQDVSLEICSPVSSNTHHQSKESTKLPQVNNVLSSQSLSFSQFGVVDHQVRNNDDVMSVLYTLVNKRKNTVIVGESLGVSEGIIRGIMNKFERGQVPGDLKYAQFISLPLFSLRNLSKEEVEKKLIELRCLVKSYMGRGVVLYLGDLKWVCEFWSTYGEQRRNYYSSVEYIIMEFKRLVCEIGETERLWLVGIANFQTYMRCKTGHPSLETLWELHPLTIPVGNLSLSLNLDSDSPTEFTSKVDRIGFNSPLLENGYSGTLSIASGSIQKKEYNSTLPSWLQQYKEESRRNTIHDQKWNSFSSQVHVHTQPQHAAKVLNFSSSSSPFSISISSPDHQLPKQLPKEHQFWVSEIISDDEEGYESSTLMTNQVLKPDLLSNPNSSPNSASSSEAIEEDMDDLNRFKVFNDENLKIICDALEVKVSWQKEIIPEIARTILQCRSRNDKEETWLSFLGDDNQGKEKMAREVAKVVFGSESKFISIGLTSNFSDNNHSTEGEEDSSRKKRGREELISSSYLERFGLALNENPHRVFFMEDIEQQQVDYSCLKGIKQAIESGNISLPDGEIIPLKDSIIIFSCDNSILRKPKSCCRDQEEKEDNEESRSSLDLNIAIDDHEHEDGDYAVGDHDIRRSILDSVDRQTVFKIQES